MSCSRGHQWSSVVISSHPTHPRVMHELLEGSSVVISGHRWPSMVINGHQWSSVVIGGHRWPSVVINGHQWSSVVISSHQWSSVVITRTHLLDGQAFGRVLPE